MEHQNYLRVIFQNFVFNPEIKACIIWSSSIIFLEPTAFLAHIWDFDIEWSPYMASLMLWGLVWDMFDLFLLTAF